jgi:SAM-dependent MidA family methyltransferase
MRDRILHEIQATGPWPFERFMRESLYGEGGYFNTATLRSEKAGDFLTSPEVSPLFGETIGAFVAAERERIGEPFELIEVAAGSGSLLGPLLRVVDVSASVIEVSPAARRHLEPIVGSDNVFERWDQLDRPVRGVVVANELLDNLPMAVAQLTDDGWRERWVAADDGRLVLVDANPRPETLEWLEAWAGPVDVGGWVEVQIEAGEWVGAVLRDIEAGSLVVIDYGDTTENLLPRRQDGTLRTYRAHHLGPHPLAEPGATDITADVNFSAMAGAADRAGATVDLVRQDDFLARWGLRARISEMRHAELAAARNGDTDERLRIMTDRQAAQTVMNPRGLGDFRVLTARI